MTLPNYPSSDVEAFGEKVNAAMYDASIRASLGGLGGCETLDLNDFDEDVRPYIQAYLEGNLDSVAVTYAAMRTRELGEAAQTQNKFASPSPTYRRSRTGGSTRTKCSQLRRRHGTGLNP